MIRGTDNIQVRTSNTGVNIIDTSRKYKIFEITGGSNPYAAKEIYIDESDGSSGDAPPLVISTGDKLLHELTGRDDVAPGSKVMAFPNPRGQGWIFKIATTEQGYRSIISVVTDVCTDADGHVISVEKRDLTLPEGVEIGDRYCETPPHSGCCVGSDESNWYCIDGECIEVFEGVDTSGFGTAHATLSDCQDACNSEVETVSTACCTNDVPAILTVTVTNKTGTCTCWPNSFTLSHNGTDWINDSLTDCSGGIYNVVLSCVGVNAENFALTVFHDSVIQTPGALEIDTASCDPFSLTFLFNFLSGPCVGGLTMTVTA